ncbi:plasmid pRiA4b ORF-3 family protein [Actinomadura sp. B10D3]|uniref:plasmid pRiA4b ORF-3 family protein n=1 Tax=Actinomadura sp. B10D3 TaxID=3153557 RepID=UPI00325C5CAC
MPQTHLALGDDPALLTEMAKRARDCEVLVTAQELAEWIGAGRDLTARGVLRPGAAVEACAVLGIDAPKKPRSALDIDELMMAWSAAAGAGFIEITDRRVVPGPALREWQDGDARAAVAIWTQCAVDGLGLAEPAEPEDLDYLAVLCTLYDRGATATLDALATGIDEFPGGGDGAPCPDCGEFHGEAAGFPDLFGLIVSPRERAETAVLDLAEFGVVTVRDDAVELSVLGRWLTTVMFHHSAPAADTDVAEFVTTLDGLPPMVARLMARPWLDARTPASAAGELLALAKSAEGSARIQALQFARQCGPEAAPAWEEYGTSPGFGAYARIWLAEHNDKVPGDGDEAWATVDTLVAMLDAFPEEATGLMLPMIVQQLADSELAEALPQLAASGHPAAGRLVQALEGSVFAPQPVTMQAAPGPERGKRVRSDQAYQIKITLGGVSTPPVWRRVLVPAEIGLDRLHLVIQRAMGWHDCHLHVFTEGDHSYGVPDAELGHRDESAVPLSALLSDPGDKLHYTYDFGDGWEHEIRLEKILPLDTGTSYPVATAGKGACPPEDCGGTFGYADLKTIMADPTFDEHQEMLDWLGLQSPTDFDPAEFSLAAVNTRLGPISL